MKEKQPPVAVFLSYTYKIFNSALCICDEGRVTFYLLSLPPHPALGQFSVGFGDDCHTLPLPFSPTGCGRGRFILHSAFCILHLNYSSSAKYGISVVKYNALALADGSLWLVKHYVQKPVFHNCGSRLFLLIISDFCLYH